MFTSFYAVKIIWIECKQKHFNINIFIYILTSTLFFNQRAMMALDCSPELCNMICHAYHNYFFLLQTNMPWNIFIVGHPGNISTKLFFINQIRQNSPIPGDHNFPPINMAWRNQLKCHPRNIFRKWFGKWPDSLGE